jgi:SAM-dependent methyltransferase
MLSSVRKNKPLRDVLGKAGQLIFIGPLAYLCQKYLSLYYSHLFWKQWHKKMPAWFDHRIDLYTWENHLNAHWAERGIYAKEVIKSGSKVLDISCGDGFYGHFFYTSMAEQIDCIDIDPRAINHARKYHSHPKIRYFCSDAIADEFPQKEYDVICFDGALAHFSKQQLDILLPKIKKSLSSKGIFCGSEEMETKDNLSHDHHMVLPTKEDFIQLLSPYFDCVKVFISESPSRKTIYFRCASDEQVLERF